MIAPTAGKDRNRCWSSDLGLADKKRLLFVVRAYECKLIMTALAMDAKPVPGP